MNKPIESHEFRGTHSGEIIKDFPRPPADLVERLGRLPVANISDAMAKSGVLHHEVRPVWPGVKACGPALTCGSVDLTVKKFALSLARAGDVFVLAAGGVRDYACFGELSAQILAARGAAGDIVDGAVRDITGIREASMPVFARAVTPRNYHYPFGLEHGSINRPVVCAGVIVCAGDIVVAGDDGVVIVPQAHAERVADEAAAIEAEEARRRVAIMSGKAPLAAIEDELRAAGYSIA